MTWTVFGGDAHEIYLAMLKERCERDGLGTSDEVLARQFRLHLHRGIGYLAAPQSIRSIGDLIQLATGDTDAGQTATGPDLAEVEHGPEPAPGR
jgi:DNA sulfur modification protein DndE